MTKTLNQLATVLMLLTCCLAAHASNTNTDGATVYLTHGQAWSAISTSNPDGAHLAAIGVQDATGYQQTAEAQLVTQPFVMYDPLLPPDAATAVAPADGSIGADTSPLLDWTDAPRAATYDLYGWKSTNAKPASPQKSNTANTQWQVPITLPQTTQFSWQITARNIWGETNSTVFTFTTLGAGTETRINGWSLYR